MNPVIPSAAQLKAWKYELAEPPFYPPPDKEHRKLNYWMMSQRGGTLSYPLFTAGFSLMLMGIFIWLADVKGMRLGVFRTLGVNSLIAYMLPGYLAPHALKLSAWIYHVKEVNKQSDAFEVYTAFGIMFLMVYLILRVLEWRKIFIRM